MGVLAGLAMGWEQLVLLGIAPLLVSLLPCLIMCGLGLCMMKCQDKKGKATDQGEVSNVQAKAESSEIQAEVEAYPAAPKQAEAAIPHEADQQVSSSEHPLSKLQA